MMLQQKLHDVLFDRVPPRYLIPLFWQHGESREAIAAEIDAMHRAHIGAFVLESRPFPEFLQEAWFDTVEFALRQAEKHGMKVYLFDDSHFPSGYADGIIARQYPQYLRQLLRMDYLDAVGPRPGIALSIHPWLKSPEDRLFKVIAVRMSDQVNALEPGSAVDLTDKVAANGRLYWDLPEGRWRICIFCRTRDGGEEHTRDYVNLLDPAAVRCYIDQVYEPHYRRFQADFGHTLMGFFSDEPRFGSAPYYDATLGKIPMVIPFDEQLPALLAQETGEDFSTRWPWLWFGDGEAAAQARVAYMELVSRRYSACFTGQIGAWCREHGVDYLGHVVEDNGAHARIGLGSGHFFRALDGQSWAGVDTVLLQNIPGFSEGFHPTPFSPPLDSRFYHWGLGKLGASCGHLNPAMGGVTFCEIFGAYGWNEGLRYMKWMTDHFLVRGVNRLMPHAFSPMAFPDPDCPPHFFAGGHNPQWRLFPVWSSYANRVCHLLSDGLHQATAAVLYHAEAEWSGGAFEPFEAVVRLLGLDHIDCDVVCADMLEEARVEAGRVKIAQEAFDVLVVPYGESRPAAVIALLRRLAEAGLPVIFLREKPQGVPGMVLDEEELSAFLRRQGWYDVEVAGDAAELRFYHYVFADGDVYFWVNESIRHELAATVRFREAKRQWLYDPMSNRSFPAEESTEVALQLAPGQSIMVIRGVEPVSEVLPPSRETVSCLPLPEEWDISLATAEAYPCFTSYRRGKLGNLAVPGVLPEFSGTIRYRCHLALPEFPGAVWLDLGELWEAAEVYVNGCSCGRAIAPPYCFDVSACLRRGDNEIQVDVTNTLAKSHGDNLFDRGLLQDPSGLLGPVCLRF